MSENASTKTNEMYNLRRNMSGTRTNVQHMEKRVLIVEKITISK